MAIDLTKKEVLLPILRLEDMYNRGTKYAKANPKEKDFKVYVNFSTKSEYVMWNKVKTLKSELATRVKAYIDKNKVEPTSIWINQPKTVAVIKSEIQTWKTNMYIQQVIKVIGNFDNGKELVEKIRDYAKKKGGLYKYYLNSRLIGTQKEIEGLTNGSLGNCVDWSQLGYVLLTIMGYNVRYVQWQCTNVTHLTVEVKGLDFGDSYKIIDLAAIVDANSRRYEIGEHWCSNTRVATNPGWMFE